MKRKLVGAGAGLAVLVAGLATAAPASAAQSTQSLDCGSAGTLVIRTNNNNSSDNGGWSAAQVVSGGSGHLIPTSFSFSAYDVTTQMPLYQFAQDKGNGNANQNQSTVSCTQTETDTLANILEPGDQLPPGASLTDIVTVTFSATAVPKP